MLTDYGVVEVLRTHVALAREPFDTVVWIGVDYLTDGIRSDGGDVDEAAIARTVWDATDSLFAEHVAAQSQWPATTDSDRLTAAFGELGRTGVAAREVFTCCQNCGHSEILDGYKEPPRGYVFYHQQDAERGIAGQGVHLAYSPRDDDAAFAGEVVEALRRNGLQPRWDGSTETRIFVPMTWQRRRTGRLAAYPGSLPGPDFTVDAEPIGWAGPHAMAAGARSAKAWAALRLPWLPTGASVRLTADDRTMVVRREWDQLVDDRGNVVGRRDPWALVSDAVSPATGAADQPPMLEVQFDQRDMSSNGQQVPMTLDECGWLLRTAPVHRHGFTIYSSRSGTVVQHSWNADGTLWMEYLDPTAHESRGRLVNPTEAVQVIADLALEDRVSLGDLGPLETTTW